MFVRAEVFDFLEAEGAADGICLAGFTSSRMDFFWPPLKENWSDIPFIKGSLGGETSVLRTFRMSGKELVKERVSKERVSQRNS